MRRPKNVRTNEPLAAHTTFQIGGNAAYFVTVTDPAELRTAVMWAKEEDIPITILGGGSNVLIPDEGVSGLVIQVAISGKTYSEVDDQVYITAGAGDDFDAFVAELVSKDIWGLENLSSIPGSVGATPVQNVGAYGVEVSEYITSVVAYNTQDDTFVVFDNAHCGFRYRHSMFKREENKHLVVVYVTFELSMRPMPRLQYKDLATRFSEGAAPALREIRDAVIDIRSHKFPDWRAVGTAGSFFKNPIIDSSHYEALKKVHPDMPGFALGEDTVKVPLGWILDHVLHMRGVREGNVGTYEGQALVVINHGSATAKEVTQFAEHIRQAAKEATDIDVEWEVTKISQKAKVKS